MERNSRARVARILLQSAACGPSHITCCSTQASCECGTWTKAEYNELRAQAFTLPTASRALAASPLSYGDEDIYLASHGVCQSGCHVPGAACIRVEQSSTSMQTRARTQLAPGAVALIVIVSILSVSVLLVVLGLLLHRRRQRRQIDNKNVVCDGQDVSVDSGHIDSQHLVAKPEHVALVSPELELHTAPLPSLREEGRTLEKGAMLHPIGVSQSAPAGLPVEMQSFDAASWQDEPVALCNGSRAPGTSSDMPSLTSRLSFVVASPPRGLAPILCPARQLTPSPQPAELTPSASDSQFCVPPAAQSLVSTPQDLRGQDTSARSAPLVPVCGSRADTQLGTSGQSTASLGHMSTSGVLFGIPAMQVRMAQLSSLPNVMFFPDSNASSGTLGTSEPSCCGKSARFTFPMGIGWAMSAAHESEEDHVTGRSRSLSEVEGSDLQAAQSPNHPSGPLATPSTTDDDAYADPALLTLFPYVANSSAISPVPGGSMRGPALCVRRGSAEHSGRSGDESSGLALGGAWSEAFSCGTANPSSQMSSPSQAGRHLSDTMLAMPPMLVACSPKGQ